MMGLEIAFWVLAILVIVAALAVVFLRDIFRAALCLVLCFLAVAGIYVTLSADFLAVVQVLIYVGAISVLIILAIMLTRGVQRGSPSNKLRIPAFLVAILFLGLLIFTVTRREQWQIAGVPPVEPTTSALAVKLFGEGGFILAVEIAAVLLLAAILGAIVLVREK